MIKVVLEVKNPPANAGDTSSVLGWEDPREEGMATHSSILAWRISWTEEPGRLWSIGSQTVGHDWSNLACVVVQLFSHVWLFVTPWIVAQWLICPWGFSRQEYWSGLPCPPPGDLPNPGIEPRSPALQVDSLPSEPPGKPWDEPTHGILCIYLFHIL